MQGLARATGDASLGSASVDGRDGREDAGGELVPCERRGVV